MKKILIGTGIAMVGVVVAVAGLAVYKRANVETYEFESKRPEEDRQIKDIPISGTLVANAEDEEEAKEIAELYGIILTGYEYGVATYVTEKDPTELIKMGEEKGYPSISVDNIQSID